ncbi:hypothetical protein GJ496_008962 [Pomphorhynchus laevis]|nr:hypothetical protein GJ496_008962 [Pomphorhynchus laevis]
MAYRQACLIYHPDKQSDPNLKQSAITTFQRIKAAYDVLIDPDKRAVYDIVGSDALGIESIELVAREKSLWQILTEYKLSCIDKDNEQFLLHSNIKGQFTCELNVSDFGSEGLRGGVSLEKIYSWTQAEFPVNKQTVFRLGYALECDDSLRGDGSLSTSIQYMPFNSSSDSIALTALIGPNPRCTFELNSFMLPLPLSVRLDALLFNRNKIVPQLRLQTSYKLTDNITSEVSYAPFSPNSFLSTALSFNSERYFTRLSIKLSSRYRSRISIQFGKMWSSIMLNSSIAYSLNHGISFKLFGEYSLSRWTTVSTELQLRLDRVALDLRITRGPFCYSFPIIFTNDETSLASVVYSVAFSGLIQWLIRKIYMKHLDYSNAKDKEHPSYLSQLRNRRLALDQQHFLLPIVERISQTEYPNGLIIVRAIFGDIYSSNEGRRLDVRIPLQSMVNDGKLELGKSKTSIIGFYNPNPNGPSNKLLIDYYYKGYNHQIVIDEGDVLRLPQI